MIFALFTLALATNVSLKCDISLSLFTSYCHIFKQKVPRVVGFFLVIRLFASVCSLRTCKRVYRRLKLKEVTPVNYFISLTYVMTYIRKYTNH
jgi:hypothetical protein